MEIAFLALLRLDNEVRTRCRGGIYWVRRL